MTNRFTYNDIPIMQCGYIETGTDGYGSVTFPIAFPSSGGSVVVSLTPNRANSGTYPVLAITSMIVVSIVTCTHTSLTIHGMVKDGRSGQTGGAYYNGIVDYVAHFVLA